MTLTTRSDAVRVLTAAALLWLASAALACAARQLGASRAAHSGVRRKIEPVIRPLPARDRDRAAKSKGAA